MEDLPKEISRAYARRLRRFAGEIEKTARIGADWLRDSHREKLAGLWRLSGAALRLADEFDPPVDTEAPGWWPEENLR